MSLGASSEVGAEGVRVFAVLGVQNGGSLAELRCEVILGPIVPSKGFPRYWNRSGQTTTPHPALTADWLTDQQHNDGAMSSLSIPGWDACIRGICGSVARRVDWGDYWLIHTAGESSVEEQRYARAHPDL